MADVISFRASYETEAHWRVLPNVKSAVSVAEAKVLIARELGLEREFARTFDLELYILGAEDERTLLSDDDNNLVLPGTKLVVNRVLWGQVANVVHSSNKAVGAWVKGAETRHRHEELPDGLKCARCHNLARNPLLARCSRGCTKSVCKACAEIAVARGTPAECPVCNQRTVASFVPNRTLAMLVAKIDSTAANSSGDGAGDAAGQSQSKSRRPNAEDTTDMWLLFVAPQQLAIVHRDGFVVLPWNAHDTFCQRLKDMITLCVLATGGGGTSIVSPGSCRVQRLWYCKEVEEDGGEGSPPAGVGNTPSLQPLVDMWFKESEQTLQGDGYLILELQWISRYPSLVLLPGKAQPIAGILAAAPKDAYAINLTNTQKQGVTQRLYSEAHFARCSGSAPAPAGLGTILARLRKSAVSVTAPAAAEDPHGQKEPSDKLLSFLRAQRIWTGTPWSKMLATNPLIPWTATLPKLTEAQFTAVRQLQMLASNSSNAAPPPKQSLTEPSPANNPPAQPQATPQEPCGATARPPERARSQNRDPPARSASDHHHQPVHPPRPAPAPPQEGRRRSPATPARHSEQRREPSAGGSTARHKAEWAQKSDWPKRRVADWKSSNEPNWQGGSARGGPHAPNRDLPQPPPASVDHHSQFNDNRRNQLPTIRGREGSASHHERTSRESPYDDRFRRDPRSRSHCVGEPLRGAPRDFRRSEERRGDDFPPPSERRTPLDRQQTARQYEAEDRSRQPMVVIRRQEVDRSQPKSSSVIRSSEKGGNRRLESWGGSAGDRASVGGDFNGGATAKAHYQSSHKPAAEPGTSHHQRAETPARADRRRIVVESSDESERGDAAAAARLFNASLPRSKRPRNTLFS